MKPTTVVLLVAFGYLTKKYLDDNDVRRFL